MEIACIYGHKRMAPQVGLTAGGIGLAVTATSYCEPFKYGLPSSVPPSTIYVNYGRF